VSASMQCRDGALEPRPRRFDPIYCQRKRLRLVALARSPRRSRCRSPAGFALAHSCTVDATSAAVAQSSASRLPGPVEPSMHRIPECQGAVVRLPAGPRANAAHLRMMTARGLPETGMRCVSPIAFLRADHGSRLGIFDLDPILAWSRFIAALPMLRHDPFQAHLASLLE
jgi:hypothetical protein